MTHGPKNNESASRNVKGKSSNPPEPGTRYGRWTVLDIVDYRKTADRVRPYVLCCCDCGKKNFVNVRNLRQGNSQSCGCLHIEQASKANATHHQTGQRLYRIWKQMHQRCENPNARSYRWYGAKGVRVCKAWEKFEPFRDWALNAGYFAKAEIDRKNSAMNYSPKNCQWVTKAENLINKQNLLPVHLERKVREVADKEGVPAVIVIRRAVEMYVMSPSPRRKRVAAR